MSVPLYTPAEARSRETFLALMWALSYPGRVYQLPDTNNPFALIAETLLDLETSYYTAASSLEPVLAQTGAQVRPAAQAAYHFYPAVSEPELADIRAASVGTMLYPDEAATLIIGCQVGSGLPIVLQGPGVNGRQNVQIDGITARFWDMREIACRFPLGWDVYFVDGRNVVGLPRSVQVKE